MILAAQKKWQQAFFEKFAGSTCFVKQVSNEQWHLFPWPGKDSLIKANVIDDYWLVFDGPILSGKKNRIGKRLLWKLLCLNTELPAGVKIVIHACNCSAHLRAEIPMDQDDMTVRQANRLWQGYQMSWENLQLPSNLASVTVNTDEDLLVDDKKERVCDLRNLCEKSGWEYKQGGSGQLSVKLEVPHFSYLALLEQSPKGQVVVYVELGAYESLPASARSCLGLLLLTAGGLVRMVRAVGVKDAQQIKAGFEVAFALVPTVSQFKHALAALSVVCRLCGAEAQVFADRKVSRELFSVRGWPS